MPSGESSPTPALEILHQLPVVNNLLSNMAALSMNWIYCLTKVMRSWLLRILYIFASGISVYIACMSSNILLLIIITTDCHYHIHHTIIIHETKTCHSRDIPTDEALSVAALWCTACQQEKYDIISNGCSEVAPGSTWPNIHPWMVLWCDSVFQTCNIDCGRS